MEIHEIKNLDCRIKKNRQILAREVATLLGRDSALSNEQIQKAAEKISKKYKFHISQIQYSIERKEEIFVGCLSILDLVIRNTEQIVDMKYMQNSFYS